MTHDNKAIYNAHWQAWVDMKRYGPANRWLRSLLVDVTHDIAPEQVVTILDVGCGEGTNTAFLAEVFAHADITGIDFSSEGIRIANMHYAREKLHFRFDDESFVLKNYQFDLITSFDVLEHIHDWQAFLIDMSNAANKYILLAVPTGKMRPFEIKVGHLRNFKSNEIESFLAARGWRVKEAFYAGFPFYSPIYRDICNIFDVGDNDYVKGNYGFFTKVLCSVLFGLFAKCSTKRKWGDYFVGLFEKDTVSRADDYAVRLLA